MIPYKAPKYNLSSFNCPHCQAFSSQHWVDVYAGFRGDNMDKIKLSFCDHCKKYSLWHKCQMISPEFSGVEPPNQDLDIEIQNDYIEAAGIIQKSPRGAAALLRLAIQKLCKQLGKSGKNVNNDIASLVKDGLPEKIQKALDTVRVTGNEAVHPGVLDLKDNIDIAYNLFKLVNFITEKMITEPQEIDSLYEAMPDDKKEEIKKRDNSS